MQLYPHRYQAISEMAYLSPAAENVMRYRTILRFFYYENERMNYQLYREDVYSALKVLDEFSGYTLEELNRDLETLRLNRNLIAIQDPSKANTIEEYKNKQFRYMLSDTALEVERLTISLENLRFEKSAVSANMFARIFDYIEQMPELLTQNADSVYLWWQDLQDVFRRMTQSYKDYLRDFYSEQAAAVMQSVEFLAHKQHLLSYLEDFIRELQQYRRSISYRLSNTPQADIEKIIAMVVEAELAVPRVTGQLNAEELRDNILGKWNMLHSWFCDTEGRQSECMLILEATNNVITKVIRNANLILQMRNIGISKKTDYQKFFQMFDSCANLEKAHILSAHVFGVHTSRHYTINTPRGTDNLNSSIFSERPEIVFVKPRVRGAREKQDQHSFRDRSAEKAAARAKYLQALDRERTLVEQYIHEQVIDFSRITDTVSAVVRNTLLNWVAMAHVSEDKRGRTEFGREYTLKVDYTKRCLLKCDDGTLDMPAYALVFSEDEG